MNNTLALTPLRCATTETESPDRRLSATIRLFSPSLHRRRGESARPESTPKYCVASDLCNCASLASRSELSED